MSIQSDDNSGGLTEEAAESALLASLTGGDAADQDDQDDDGDEGDETPEDLDQADDGDEGDDEDPQDDPDGGEEGEEASEEAPAKPEVSDETELSFQLNGEDHKVTIGSLKRLAGQEANLTRKSQEAERVGASAAAGLQAAIEVIAEDLAPYDSVDWMVLQQEMDPDTFKWHRENANRLKGKYDKLVQAAQGVEHTFTERRQGVDREAAAEAIRELKADIPGWNDKLYGEIMQYGAAQGLDPADLAKVTNPKVIKLIRKAMIQDAAEKVATKKVKQAPARVIKGGQSAQGGAKQAVAAKAMKRLQTSGSDDAAVAALLGRWA